MGCGIGRGGNVFDSHVHAAPDITHRFGDDATIAQQYVDETFSGFVLKGHYESTVGRAAAVAATSGLDVVGGIALNRTVGGINSHAVLTTLVSGGRMVWFPTADCHTQEDAGLPRLANLDRRLSRATVAIPPVTADQEQINEIMLVLDLIAEFDAVLCTGHLSTAECRWLFDQAQRRGITRFLLTHPSYTVPEMSLREIMDFADQGAFVEMTAFQLWHQPNMTIAKLAEVARVAGDKLILASDAGQPDSPPPPEALQELVDRLTSQGCDSGILHAAAAETPRQLVLR